MSLDATKWQYRTDKSIRYIGPAHGAAGANYVSVYEMHRWLQDLADDASSANDDYLDITIPNPSDNEGGLTVRDVLRLVLAVTAGDATGLEGATMKFKSLDGTKDRVEATYAAGDRTVTARDVS